MLAGGLLICLTRFSKLEMWMIKRVAGTSAWRVWLFLCPMLCRFTFGGIWKKHAILYIGCNNIRKG